MSWLSRTIQYLQESGMSALDAGGTARQMIWAEVQRQAGMLAFVDTFYTMLTMIILVIPFVFLLKAGVTKGKKTSS
ncbi:MAG: hypothetical protein ABIV48_06455 [Pyrinomonadaceae bacterium]